jgi:hypothetical protein
LLSNVQNPVTTEEVVYHNGERSQQQYKYFVFINLQNNIQVGSAARDYLERVVFDTRPVCGGQ